MEEMQSLIGRKIATWVDMKKIDILLHQIRSGMIIDSTAFDEFIVSLC
jgi:hypothetical protein